MSLWWNDGGIVYEDQGLTWCDHCPCETGTGTGSTGTGTETGTGTTGTGTTGTGTPEDNICPYCIDKLAAWEVEVYIPSVTNGSFCSNCGDYVGWYALPKVGFCTWASMVNDHVSGGCAQYDIVGAIRVNIGSLNKNPFIVADTPWGKFTLYNVRSGSGSGSGSGTDTFDCMNFDEILPQTEANPAPLVCTGPDWVRVRTK